MGIEVRFLRAQIILPLTKVWERFWAFLSLPLISHLRNWEQNFACLQLLTFCFLSTPSNGFSHFPYSCSTVCPHNSVNSPVGHANISIHLYLLFAMPNKPAIFMAKSKKPPIWSWIYSWLVVLMSSPISVPSCWPCQVKYRLVSHP